MDLQEVGKTSLVKCLANQYSMDIFIVNMDRDIDFSSLQKLFKSVHNSKGYHILGFEDIDRCYQIRAQDSDFMELQKE